MNKGKLKENKYRRFYRGEALLYILIFVLFIGTGLWYIRGTLTTLWQNYYQYVLFPDNANKSITKNVQNEDTSKWKSVSYPEFSLTLRYPPLWAVSEDKRISQFGIPSVVSDSSKLNIIKVSSHQGVLVDGYYDPDLFYRLYNLGNNEPFMPEANNVSKVRFFKIASGRTLTSHPYVVFRTERSPDYPSADIVQAYILRGHTLIILTLSNYDQTGKDMLIQIAANSSL
jgi:hypothetical protein